MISSIKNTRSPKCQCGVIVKYCFCPDCGRPTDKDESVYYSMAIDDRTGKLHTIETVGDDAIDLGEIDFGKGKENK